jgi:hypothetical protein
VHGEQLSYDAACLSAKAGQADEAFEWLRRAAKDGDEQSDWLAQDPDLASLHKDARFAEIKRAFAANHDRRIAAEPAKDRALQRELLAMAKVDQDARAAAVAGHLKDPKVFKHAQAVDRKNTARMKEILAAHGWPGRSLVGPTASQAAWLLVQHADQDPAFQEQALTLLADAVKHHEAEGRDLAYLTDRVRDAQHKPQLYGTQFVNQKGTWVAAPIEDEAHVDERRAAVGLPPLAVYRQQLMQRYGATAPPLSDAGTR